MGLIIEIIFIIVIVLIILINLALLSLSKKLKDIPNEKELSGFEIAKKISSKLAEDEPHIIKKNGKFLDYYDTNRNVIKLSPEVFDGTDMYAAIMAINIALETDKTKLNRVKGNNLNSFLVIVSYILIIIGTFLNNYHVIDFGFLLFIIAFVLQFMLSSLYGKTKEEIEITEKFIKKEKVIKPYETYKDNSGLLALVSIARLPYSFINNFK